MVGTVVIGPICVDSKTIPSEGLKWQAILWQKLPKHKQSLSTLSNESCSSRVHDWKILLEKLQN